MTEDQTKLVQEVVHAIVKMLDASSYVEYKMTFNFKGSSYEVIIKKT